VGIEAQTPFADPVLAAFRGAGPQPPGQWCASSLSVSGRAWQPMRELVGAARYPRIDGPVYSVGGAFADYVLQKYGPWRFPQFYFACRPARVEGECQTALGVELDALEPASGPSLRSWRLSAERDRISRCTP
jgi:hypothetical protein